METGSNEVLDGSRVISDDVFDCSGIVGVIIGESSCIISSSVISLTVAVLDNSEVKGKVSLKPFVVLKMLVVLDGTGIDVSLENNEGVVKAEVTTPLSTVDDLGFPLVVRVVLSTENVEDCREPVDILDKPKVVNISKDFGVLDT